MKKILFFFAFLFTGILSAQTPFYKDIIVQKLLPALKLNGLNGYIDFYNGDLLITHSSNKLTLSGGYFDFGPTRPIYGGSGLLNFTDSTLYYFSLVRGIAMELDLATYTTLPSPGTPGNVLTDDGTGWGSAAPAVGSGGSGGTDILYTYDLFVGDAGAPSNNDTSWTQTNFVENRVKVYRAGYRQHRNPTGILQTTHNGYRFQPATGELVFKPPLATGENLIVEVYDSTNVTEVDPPAPGVSTLLDSLKTYYKLDEVAGTDLVDAVGNKNITTLAQINQTGKIGKAVHPGYKKGINGQSYNAATTLNWSTWTVKLWFKLDSLPSATGRAYCLFSTFHTSAPYTNVLLRVEQTNKLRVRTTNNAWSEIYSYGDTISVANRWYHVVVRFRGNGYATQIYKDGHESTEAGAQVFTGTLFQVNGGEAWGAATPLDDQTWTGGLVDECSTSNRAWTDGEILESYTKEKALTSYPW